MDRSFPAALLEPVFANTKFFLSEDFSLIDCCIAPILWRLPSFDITIPKTAQAILDYKKRTFERKSFRASLTETERELRLELEHL